MARESGPRRLQRLTVGVLLGTLSISCLAFFLAAASVNDDDRLLLGHEASQGSLVLSSYLSQTKPPVAGIEAAVTPNGVDQRAWTVAAAAAAMQSGVSSLALVRAVGGHLEMLSSYGAVRMRFGTAADVALAKALEAGHTPFETVVNSGGSHALVQLSGLPAVAGGYGLYSELTVPPYISLSSLAGHPFADIAAALYAGKESPGNLVFATTRHLPLTGQLAVVVLPTATLSSAKPVITDQAGSVSSPGNLVLVVVATANLAGAFSARMPWILLVGLLAVSMVVAVLFEISGRRRAEAVMTARELGLRNALLDEAAANQQRSDARFAAMVRSSSDLTTVVAADGTILYQSPSSDRLLGSSPESMVGTNFSAGVHGDDIVLWHRALANVQKATGAEISAGWRLRTAAGDPVPVETRLTNLIDDPAVGGVVLNSRDVSERIRLEEELRHQAFHDSLTGLANRALFQDRVEHAVARMERAGGAIGVLFLDLDDFKAVNDGRGHGAGDELLRAAAARLSETLRAGDTLARLGGDEFAVLLESGDPAAPAATAERILEALRRPVSIAGGDSGIRASIGIVTSTDSSAAADELLRDADIAMYAAKSAGKGRCETFHPGLHHEVIRRLQLETELGRAVENGELAVQYQPIIDLNSGEITGVEALMRWHHPHRGTVMPNDFIPVAESTGLIVPMGRWLLREACRDLRQLQEQTERFDLHLAVNISARQLEDPALVSDVAGALDESGLLPTRLTLEITESVFVAHPEKSMVVLDQLKSLGVRISIDDFGTGYSSLAYLQRLPVDELKIDRSFISPDAPSAESAALVQTIVRLADDLGLEAVAEGIETAEQLQRLRQTGCHLAQGFLFARPAELADVRRLVASTEHPDPVLTRRG